MTRTSPAQTPELIMRAPTPERMAVIGPGRILFDAIRRYRTLLLAILALSVSGALAISSRYCRTMVTAHLQLEARNLPLGGADLYQVPAPTAVGELVTTRAMLQPTVERYHLASVTELQRSLTVTPDLQNHLLKLDLRLPIDRDVPGILNSIGRTIAQAVVEDRRKLLDAHSEYVRERLKSSMEQLELVRIELIEERRMAGSDHVLQVQHTGEIQNLMARCSQLEFAGMDASRQLARTERDLRTTREKSSDILLRAIEGVIQGRRRQIEQFARGLQPGTPRSVQQQQLLTELEALKTEAAEVRRLTAVSPAASSPRFSGEKSQAALPSSPTAMMPVSLLSPSDSSPAGQLDELSEDLVNDPARPPSALDSWLKRIEEVGRPVLGELDEETLQSKAIFLQELEEADDDCRKLEREQSDLQMDIEFSLRDLQSTKQMLRQAMQQQPTGADDSPIVMQLASAVTQHEQQTAWLAQQISRIDQLRQCTLQEYYISAPATYNPLVDVKSDQWKLFVLSLALCGGLFLSPVATAEFLRWRPAPAEVMSRRWNLPLLGTGTNHGFLPEKRNSARRYPDTAVRLLALRLQQVALTPSGKVILFSGLDHDESPMPLIIDVAQCLSQRDEQVLIIQTHQTPLTVTADKARSATRPGLSEYLAGETDSPNDVISATEIPAVFLLHAGLKNSSSEAMASPRLTLLIEEFRRRFSMILVCGPSTLNPADLQMVAARVDGILFTVTRQSLRDVYGADVLQDLLELNAPLLGFTEQPRVRRMRHQVHTPAALQNDAH